ncbi:MAG: spondin domain-containing protein, partial [Polyangiaceae bacterium]
KAFTSSGVFNTPVGDLTPGPATPGKVYTFTVDAGRKQKLSFATMLAATNDLFFAPNGNGIALYHSDDGTPIGSIAVPVDVTSQVFLWDAGTEANEEPFLGPNTVTNQTAPNTGLADPNNKVRQLVGNSDGLHTYPAVSTMIQVMVAHTTGTLFTITITDLAGAVLGVTSDTLNHPAPLSPGVWVLSNAANPLFTDQMPAPALGLEALAEDGNPTTLGAYAATTSGITYPASPGAWLIHTTGTKPLFTAGSADYGKGLEAIAEDGNAAPLGISLPTLSGYITGAVFNTPVGATTPGAILPGAKYQFTFDAKPGDSLSFASMLAATNDVFLSPGANGIALFATDGTPVTGDVSSLVSLWDAGTEGNEEPGIGPNTVTNQLAPNTGTAGEGKVQLLSAVTTDTYSYPSAQSVLKVTLATNLATN